MKPYYIRKEISKAQQDAINSIEVTPEMLKNAQKFSGLGATVCASMIGSYDLVAEMYKVMRATEIADKPLTTELVSGIANRINTQDSRITADPLFCVFQKRAVVVNEDYDHDVIAWIDSEGIEASIPKTMQLNELREDFDSDFYADDEIEWCGVEWRRLALKEVDEFVTACFTEQGCKDFLKIQGHNLRKPFTYVTSLYRNTEMIQLREWLLSHANTENKA
jgi:hypothetical protein